MRCLNIPNDMIKKINEVEDSVQVDKWEGMNQVKDMCTSCDRSVSGQALIHFTMK